MFVAYQTPHAPRRFSALTPGTPATRENIEKRARITAHASPTQMQVQGCFPSDEIMEDDCDVSRLLFQSEIAANLHAIQDVFDEPHAHTNPPPVPGPIPLHPAHEPDPLQPHPH